VTAEVVEALAEFQAAAAILRLSERQLADATREAYAAEISHEEPRMRHARAGATLLTVSE
jgi:hypothetical protein